MEISIKSIFIIAVFIIIVVIILLHKDIESTVLLLSLFANVIIITTNMYATYDRISNDKKIEEELAKNEKFNPEPQMYNKKYDIHQEYNPLNESENKEVLMIPQFDVEQDLTANERMSLLMQRRQRDRDTVASQVTKDANYYKYFYGDEFEQQEKRVWWGEANGGDG